MVGRLLHRYFIYIPDRTRVDPKAVGLQAVEEVVFKAADGTKLIAWYRPARAGKPTLLYFTGNSGNTANRAGKIKTHRRRRLWRVHAQLSPLWRFGGQAERGQERRRRRQRL